METELNKLDPGVKAAWLEDLRTSGAQQAKHRLRFTYPDGTDGFCCIGRLCNLAERAGIGHWRKQSDWEGRWDFVTAKGVSDVAAPRAVVEWAFGGYDNMPEKYKAALVEADEEREIYPGIHDPTYEFDTQVPRYDDMVHQLTGLNDDLSYDFLAIADVIERDL